MITCHCSNDALHYETNHRRGNGHIRHHTIACRPVCEQAIGKQTEKRTVCIRTKGINGIKHIRRPDIAEYDHTESEDEGKHKMSPTAKPFVIIPLTDIYTIACRKGGKSRIST